jgi:F-type H+-transporting ATPase subunit delta
VKDLVAANRYARALFEVAWAARVDQAVEDELQSFKTALKGSKETESFFTHPKVSFADKQRLLKRLYPSGEAGKILVGFFSLLLKKGRFTLYAEVADAYKRISDAAQGEGTLEIESAAPLDSEAERLLVAKIEKLSNTKLEVQKRIDPSLIGGVRVRLANRLWDGTVKGQIERLKKELTK